MTDYKNYVKDKKTEKDNKRKEFFENSTVKTVDEQDKDISKNLESSNLLHKQDKLSRTFRPLINSKDPSTFAFYGSSEQYYTDAIYNIINYYPFDGTKEDHINWYLSSSYVDTSLFKQCWPSYLGSAHLDGSQYIDFYAGGQAIPEVRYVGKVRNSEPGIVLDPKKGNTAEFWMKKGVVTPGAAPEVIFDIGTYPGKASDDKYAKFKLFLSASATGSPLHISYYTGTTGSVSTENINLGNKKVTNDLIGDSKWHHYGVSAIQEDNHVVFKLYVDGQWNCTKKVATTTDMPRVDSLMGGRLGSSYESSPSHLITAGFDDFRFWKGIRTSREISRWFDKRVYASRLTNEEYKSSLGVYYNFNKPSVGELRRDRLVIDYSGNEIIGRIENYSSLVILAISAVEQSQATENSEEPTPVIDPTNPSVLRMASRLRKSAIAYDQKNGSSLDKFIPEWAKEDFNYKSSEQKREFQTLLQIMASEFDDIRLKLDDSLTSRSNRHEDVFQGINNQSEPGTDPWAQSGSVYGDDYFIGCEDTSVSSFIGTGNRGNIVYIEAQNQGVPNDPDLLQEEESVEDRSDQISGHIQHYVTSENGSRNIHRNLKNGGHFLKNKKGTFRGLMGCYNAAGINNDVVVDKVIPINGDLLLDNDKGEINTKKQKVLTFQDNPKACIHMYSPDSLDKTYIEPGDDSQQYTFEGSFIFPKLRSEESFHKFFKSSIFGSREVQPIINDLSNQVPDNAKFTVYSQKASVTSDTSAFVLEAPALFSGELKSENFKGVYDNSRWNLSVRVIDASSENFLPSQPDSHKKYKVIFSGYRHVGSRLLNTFSLEKEISKTAFDSYNSSNKTIFLGAERENINGAKTITETDIKVINFSAWKDALTDEELIAKSRDFSFRGRFDNSNTFNNLLSNTCIFRINFEGVTGTSSGVFDILDQTSGTDSDFNYSKELKNNYDFRSYGFLKNRKKSVYVDHLPRIRPTSIESTKNLDNIKIRKNEINKFDFTLEPQIEILSFEKSMYEVISKDMVEFLCGVESLNNLIGEPVNKYRINYKLLESARRTYFHHIEGDIELEKFINYYKWIGTAFGSILSQMTPASMISNTGIQNVVESHILERNKYQHKHVFVDTRPPQPQTNLLSINELRYNWKYGHASNSDENRCLWRRERKKVQPNRKKIRKALTTKTDFISPGTENFKEFAIRNLSRPYKEEIDRQQIVNVGNNRKSNTIKDFYKVIFDKETNIILNKEDIYEFRKCNDEKVGSKNKKYSAKTKVTDIDDYTNADAAFNLPFSIYSSSVGTDFEEFKKNLQITNNHNNFTSVQSMLPNYYKIKEPHRRNEIGQRDGRIEAYKVEHDSSTLTISKPDGGISSMFHGSTISNRLYAISNIKSKLDPLIIGNYKKDYQIVQTHGRAINNNFLVENEGRGLSGPSEPSQYIFGLQNFKVPVRTKREHVFVNKFSAPGTPESMGKYGLDRESEEYSVYNSVNYRNMAIRDSLDDFSAAQSSQFGILSGTTGIPSFHKTNRNFLYRVLQGSNEREPDNYFVQHPIPRSDFGYSWIRNSTTDSIYDFLTKNQAVSYQHVYNISGSLESSQTINFLSASDVGSIIRVGYGDDRVFGYANKTFAPASARKHYIPVDFAGMNTIISEPVDTNTNTIGFEYLSATNKSGSPKMVEVNYINQNVVDGSSQGGDETFVAETYYTPGVGGTNLAGVHSVLNALILHRGGPYGWPTWKQIRASQNPATRFNRKNNIYSVSFRGQEPLVGSLPGFSFDYSRTRIDNEVKKEKRNIKRYKEIPASCKFKPINVSIHTYESDNRFTYLADTLIEGLSQVHLMSMWTFDSYVHELFLERARQAYDSVVLPSFSMRTTVQNNVTGFSNLKMSKETNFIEKPFLNNRGLRIVNSYLGQLDRIVGNYTKTEVNYLETLYPKETNTYTKNSRTRERFDFFGWNSKRSNRNITLSGNVSYGATHLMTGFQGNYFFDYSTIRLEKEFENCLFNKEDILDLNSIESDSSISSSKHMKISKWILDSREDFSQRPVNIATSYFNNENSFLSLRDQANRHEGILQNDFSYPLGMNSIRGYAPFSPLYNRRAPQKLNSNIELLSGEAKFETLSEQELGPFYDNYQDFSEKTRLMGQEYSLLSEFTISKYIEDIYKSKKYINPEIPSDFLHLTGAIYHTSSDIVSIGSQFFKTYSTSDFMKYFLEFQENLERVGTNLISGKLNLKCSAVKKFLPYRGFYPAERAVQISEIFNRNYLSKDSILTEYMQNSFLSEDKSKQLLNLKIGNAKTQVAKPLLAPGVLFNSIKTGLAVDYPIFNSSDSSARDIIIDRGKATGKISFAFYYAKFRPVFGKITDDSEFDGSYILIADKQDKNYATDGIIYEFSNTSDATGDLVGYTGPNNIPIVRVNVDDIYSVKDIVAELEKAIASPNGHDGTINTQYHEDYALLTLTRAALGDTSDYITGSGLGLDNRVLYDGFNNVEDKPISEYALFNFSTEIPYTGSLINQTVDSGIPRIKGSTSRRVNFEDLLFPERLYDESIFENEPHPSASIYYGNREFLRVLEHSPKFGTLNRETTKTDNSVKFSNNFAMFNESLLPYKSAINNFAAETVRFFLEEEKLQSAVSQPNSPGLQRGIDYKMRVYLTNDDISMYDRHSAFGPPVDEGDISAVKYTHKSNTRPGTTATGSIDLQTVSYFPDLEGKTISLTDNTTSGVEKTYRFIEDVAEVAYVPPISSSAVIDFSSVTQPNPDLSGSTISIEDYSGNEIKFRFKTETQALTSSAQIDFSSITLPNGDLSGSTITMKDYSGTEKTFRFKSEITAHTASALFSFRHYSDIVSVPEINLVASWTGSAGLDGLGVGAPYYGPIWRGFAMSGSTGYSHSIFFYDPRYLESEVVRIKFQNPDVYRFTQSSVLDANFGVDPLNLPKLTITGSEGNHAFYFYDSTAAGGTFSSLSDDYSTYINIYHTASSRAKKREELAEEFVNIINSSPSTTGSFVAAFNPATGSSSAYSPVGGVNIYSRSPAFQSDVDVKVEVHTSLFANYTAPGFKGIMNISTGSVSSWYQSSGQYGAEIAGVRSVLGFRSLWSDYYPTVTGSSAGRFVEVVHDDAQATRDNFIEAVNTLENHAYGSPNLSASAYKPGSYSHMAEVHRTDAGAQGNHIPYAPPSLAAAGFSAWESGTIFNYTAPLSRFQGGVNGASFVNASLDDDGSTIITVPVGATNTDAALSASAAIGDATNGFNSPTGMTINQAGNILNLTQSASGPAGDQTISSSGFTGTITGFSGGQTGYSFTNASLDDDGSTIIVVPVSATTADVASNAAAAIGDVTNGFNSPVGMTVSLGSTDVDLEQTTAGPSGDNPISSTDFTTVGGTITGFSGGQTEVAYVAPETYSSGDILSSHSNQIAIPLSVSTLEQLSNNVSSSIMHSNGHNRTLRIAQASSPDYTITIAQSETGSSGNTTIVYSTPSSLDGNVTGFGGGSDETIQSEPFFIKKEVTIKDSHGYLPYVPPFLDKGTSPYAEITFTPEETKNYTIPEIIDGAKIEYYNVSAPAENTNNTNYKYAMSLSASIDFKKYISLASDNFIFSRDGEKTEQDPGQGLQNYRWIIQPKWETPILDYSNVTSSVLDLSDNSVKTVYNSPWKRRNQNDYYAFNDHSVTNYLTSSRGIWHQKGEVLNNDAGKGYYMTIQGNAFNKKEGIADLAAAVGFTDGDIYSDTPTGEHTAAYKKYKLGRIAKNKIVSEGVVAIPYYLNEQCEMTFFDMDAASYLEAKEYNDYIRRKYVNRLRVAATKEEIDLLKFQYESFYETPGILAQENIAYTLRMMEKYIFPPQFDFAKDEERVRPFVSYVFQFKKEITKEDLANLWQNIYPESKYGPGDTTHSDVDIDPRKSDVEYITSIVKPEHDRFFKGRGSIFANPDLFLGKDVRWLVFKVKYRAASSYFELLLDSVTENRDDVLEFVGKIYFGNKDMDNIIDTDRKIFSNFSYNWPYDYFSIVEMIKMETKVDFFTQDVADSQKDPEEIADFLRETRTSLIQKVPLNTSGLTSTATVQGPTLNDMVFRQAVKTDEESVPTIPNQLTIPVDSGYQIKTNTESIYINGVLQTEGTGNDYTISNGVVTFGFDIEASDAVYVTYVKEST